LTRKNLAETSTQTLGIEWDFWTHTTFVLWFLYFNCSTLPGPTWPD